MAVAKTVEKTKLIVRVEAGEGTYKNMTFNSIKESATDEALFEAGNAIGDLQEMPVTAESASYAHMIPAKDKD